MNTQVINKALIASTAALTLMIMPSCSVFDPGYAAYRKQQNAATAATSNTYGVPSLNTASNPYAVPGTNGETAAPYQPIPGVSNNPTPSRVESNPAPYTPPVEAYTPLPQEPSAAGSTHTVEKGDTIWGLSRKFGVSGDEIKATNGLRSDTIWVGQRLIIPGR